MDNRLLYIWGLWLVTLPCYAAEVNVSSSASKIDFGKALLLANTSTVGIDYNGRPLWLRAMQASSGNIPTAGTITFSSNMTDGYNVLIIKPMVTSADLFPITGGSGCSLDVTNLSFSADNATLTSSAKSTTLNVGGSVKINGFCRSAYGYTGSISIPYSIQDNTENQLKTGVVVLPVEFSTEYNADVTKDKDMNFGTVVTDGTAGTVVMDYEGNIIGSTGGVVKVTGNSTAGQISIYGAENLLVTNVTNDEVIYLYNGENSVTVDTFILSPGRTFTLNENRNGQGYKMLKIGGTLHFSAEQPVGTYIGTLHVIISY